ncbi:IS200/IS605 family transposase [Rhodohalobacter sp. SW132]|uniref:IS200/IS605 family transposase n=1 Tax=Rhodohalobacter sp. SW132 TaxID=2293433 RepID=UPI000E275055|nr:IS200/IS605 family transposase [Rhodohalobacter sp. SW132]REL24879.1 IS200/IS605 family transposase [Rhodohalobacter sp. SW132]
MANTYTQTYIQFVFAVQNRKSLILPDWEHHLYKYITGIIQNKRNKMIAINGMPDHLHMFIGFHTTDSMAGLIQVVKSESSKWITDRGFTDSKFKWQEGFGAFSYSRSQINRVYHYVMNQKQHHKKKTFREEYVHMLEKFGVEYDERYIFKTVEY